MKKTICNDKWEKYEWGITKGKYTTDEREKTNEKQRPNAYEQGI